MSLFVFILLGLLLLWIISGAAVFFIACSRKKDLAWLDEKRLGEESYRKFSAMMEFSSQWLKEHRAEDIWIQSDDGLKLHAYWVPAPNALGTILLAHGYTSSPLMDFGPALEGYHRKGLNLLIPSQRSHGKSEGRFITFGVKESDDMRRWLEYHNEHFGKIPFLLSGVSMGAATVMYMLGQKLPENVIGAIVDCGFTSPKEIISHVFRRVIHLPPQLAMIPCEWFARIFGRFSLDEKDSRKTLAENMVPILMIHGTADTFVPCYMTDEGFAACAGDKRRLLVEGAGHAISYLVDKHSYEKEIDKLLKDLQLLSDSDK